MNVNPISSLMPSVTVLRWAVPVILIHVAIALTSSPFAAAQGVAPREALAQEVVAQSGGEPGSGDDLLSSNQTIHVNERGRVRLHVADLPLSDVLKFLAVQSRRNIIATPEVKGTVTAHLFDVTFEEALDAVLIPNGAGYRQRGGFIYVYTLGQLDELAATETDKKITKVYRLSYLSAQDAKRYIESLLGEEKERVGSVLVSPVPSGGLGSSASDGGGNADAAQDYVIVVAPATKQREIQLLLAELDVRPRQVLIEATILRAGLTNDNALGIDFTVVGGVDLEGLGATSNAVRTLALGELPQPRFELFNSNASTDFAKDVPSGGITVGVIKDHVAVFLRALEQVTDTTVLANPKVLALNKQKGQVIVGRRDGYITTTLTETQAVQTVEFLETGTQLIFRPFIGDDGYVRVELHPEDSVGFVNAQGLPSEQTTEVTTNVLVRDGETILIGGLFREVTTDARNQIPGLGSLPGVGALFRSNNDSTEREEVIILLTLHVVKDQDAYARASDETLEDIERIRAGVRHGLMWHGRERLAQSHYRLAVERYTEGDVDTALWHLNLSLHHNIRLMPAVALREEITKVRDWDVDGSIVREFVHRLIARERPSESLRFGRPDPISAFQRERESNEERRILPGEPGVPPVTTEEEGEEP